MGSFQSTCSKSSIIADNLSGETTSGASGQKSISQDNPIVDEMTMVSTQSFSPEKGFDKEDVLVNYGVVSLFDEYDSESESDAEEDEADLFLLERKRILADSLALKTLATHFLRPEVGVACTDGAAFGRNYFGRASAPEVEDEEDAEELAQILADAKALKQAAVDYMCREIGVTSTDGAAFGRNYFDRPSAPEMEDDEDADEHAEILADAIALKQAAVDYMCPEVGVTSTDGAAFGRNYFSRPSAPEMEDDEDAEELARIMADAKALKESAVGYMCPEIGVTSSDGASYGRNYFNRPSAPETEEDEYADERAEILADALALKNAATDYMHPEIGVTSCDGTAFGRNYFNRPSAPEMDEDADEIAAILADSMALKQAAVDYMHPEIGVKSTDGTAFGRNYFNRPSAPETEEDEYADERAEILADAVALKNAATDYMHPEIGVTSCDGAAFGRNYFNRPSAPETEDEGVNEISAILADAMALKQSAVYYMHPEIGVKSTDGAAFGRNYFNRPSAPETEEDEYADERAEILADAMALKESAAGYMHPEVGIKSCDGAAFGRNFFNRPSAPEFDEDADEIAAILADSLALKQSAVDYMHPEVGVKSTDGACFGRNYFNRPSAPETEEDEYADERAEILADALALKESAAGYMHPEVGIKSCDGAAFGRNFFNRPSAPQTEEEDADEIAAILADSLALKQAAVDYMHPEVGVKSTGGAAFGRNYFNRPSAPQTEEEDADEIAAILADSLALKQAAVDYMHPEVGVKSTGGSAFGRNFFNRPSAPQTEEEDADEIAAILSDSMALKHSAVDYMHPEVGVKSTGGAAFGRNFFNRPSAPETEEEDADEVSAILADSMALKQAAKTDMCIFADLAESVKSASIPTPAKTVAGKLASDSGRTGITKSASDVMLFGLSDEVQ